MMIDVDGRMPVDIFDAWIKGESSIQDECNTQRQAYTLSSFSAFFLPVVVVVLGVLILVSWAPL